MLRKVGHHRTDDGHVIHMLRNVWKQAADRGATLSMVCKLPGATQRVSVVVELGRCFLQGKRFSIVPAQARFGVKRIHLGGAPVHVKINDSLGFRREVSRFWRQWVVGPFFLLFSAKSLFRPHRTEGDGPESACGVLKPLSAAWARFAYTLTWKHGEFLWNQSIAPRRMIKGQGVSAS